MLDLAFLELILTQVRPALVRRRAAVAGRSHKRGACPFASFRNLVAKYCGPGKRRPGARRASQNPHPRRGALGERELRHGPHEGVEPVRGAAAAQPRRAEVAELVL